VLALDDLTRTRDGISLVVEQRLDVENGFDIAPAVQALASASLVWFELRELALPEAKDVGGNIAETRDLADAEVELVRNL
jgi:hypothetical protein